ncbi:Intracellular ribonuclease [Actinidia chinensis var. chinensis]|uniref:Intracellular ribonuclease n=1 Tax=Actinidia chinensis var. chinensis TaxID=1590841 RepID=A0A2R6RYN8_ACTCC|nr:Intracellular ribonuclease [Actinidia chinensis var. chinensis]
MNGKTYGTCSGLNQHAYFEAALRLKSQVNLLKILDNAGIQANGRFYDAGMGVEEAIRMGVGYMPGLWCNEDKTGNSQLYQVVVCGDIKGTRIIDCPGIPMRGSAVNQSSFLHSKFN